MNLFAVDPSPITSARALDDKRVVKMTLETAQLLSTAAHLGYIRFEGTPYRPTHINHPVAEWVRETPGAINWTYEYLRALLDEYRHRYGKDHACERIYSILKVQRPSMATFAIPQFCNQAKHTKRGIDFTHLPVHDAYKAYLIVRWSTDTRKPTWTKRDKPSWAASFQ